jgi:hypothetical protein
VAIATAVEWETVDRVNCGFRGRNWKRQEAGSRNCKEAGFRVQGSGTATAWKQEAGSR